MIGKAVDGEVTPRRRRAEADESSISAVCARAQADEPGDERIGKAGVVVVVAAADLLVLGDQHVFRDPLVGIGVEIFVDPVDDAAAGQLDVLRQNVIREELVVLLRADVTFARDR